MPTLVIGGFRVHIFTRDERGHRPHVHVRGNSGDAVIFIDVVEIRESRMKRNERRQAFRVVAKHRDELLEIWRRYNGE